jgi:ribonuclease P protein 3
MFVHYLTSKMPVILYTLKKFDIVVFLLQLHCVVKYFIKKSKKVLVLGRKHMQTWPPYYMDFIYRNAHVFLADNL